MFDARMVRNVAGRMVVATLFLFGALLGRAVPVAAQTTTLSGTITGPVGFNATSGSAVIAGSGTLEADATFSLEFVAEYLVVGGGGGGGEGYGGGGGGAGGFLSGSAALLSGTYGIVVGRGGAGGSSSFGATGEASSLGFLATSAGGGGGGNSRGNGLVGASGGGAGSDVGGGDAVGGTATGDGAGSDGGAASGTNWGGGGGGGASGAGGDSQAFSSAGGDGGEGVASAITGRSMLYAGGGGGAGYITNGAGGLGGGGGGDGAVGAANTGGGGGGNGGSGGSGIAIIRYLGSQGASGGTVTSGTGSAAGYTLHTYATTGTGSFVLPDLNTRLAATLAADLDGTGSLTFLGPGTLTITGANTYSGGTRVDGGTLVVAPNGSISHPSADVVVGLTAAAGTLNLAGGSIANLNGIIGSDGGGVGTVNVTAGSWSNAGILSVGAGGPDSGGGSGSLNISGGMVTAEYGVLGYDGDSAGTALLTGGTLAINADLYAGYAGVGLLSISGGGVATVAGTLYRGSSGTIALGAGGTLQIGTGGASGDLATDLTNDGLLVFDRSDDSTYAGIIDGTGAVTKRGTGTLNFTGANAFTGITTISAGRLQLGDGVTDGSIAGNVVDDGTLVFNTTLDVTYAGAISGTGAVQKLGVGTLTLSGSNTYTGGTQLDAGVLSLGSPLAISTTGAISFGGGVLQFTGSNATDYSSRFSTAGSQAFALDTNGTDVSLASAVSGTGSTLTKLGTGTLTLSAANTYSGSTTVSGGMLAVVAGGAINQPASALVVGPAGKTGVLAISGGSVANAAASVGVGNGSRGTVNLTAGAWTTLGDLVVGAGDAAVGTLAISGGTAVSTNSILGSGSSAAGLATVSGGRWTTSQNLTVGDGGAAVLTTSGSGVVVVGGTLARGDRGVINLESGGTLQIGTGGTTGSLGTDLTVSGGLVFDRSDALAFGGVIEGPGSVTKRGAGTLTLTGSNAWTGGTTIMAGTLQLGDGTITTGLLGDVANDATVIFNPAAAVGYAGAITGTGSLVKLGAGELTLTGRNEYGGGTVIRGGMLAVAAGGSISHSGANLTVGDSGAGTLLVSGGDVTNADGIVGRDNAGTATVTSGKWTNRGGLRVGADGAAGLLTISGSGVVVVGGTLLKGGSGTIDLASGGTLQIGAGGTSGALATDLTNNGAVVFNRSNDSSYAGTIDGAGTLTKLGAGRLTFTGSNDYGGGTTIRGGTLDVAGGGVIDHVAAGMVVGTAGLAGTLTLSGGRVTDAVGTVGSHGVGTAVVSAGTWNNLGPLRVGWGAAGEAIGGSGTGSLSISGGVVMNTDASLGYAAGSVAAVEIGGGTWMNSGDLVIAGGGGSASLAVTGGSVTAASNRIGSGNVSSGTLTVGGGAFATSGTLSVGFDGGTGSLLLTGGTVTSATGFVGSGNGSVGTAAVSGGLWSTSGDLVVGYDGTGSLVVSGSGVVEVAGTLSRGNGGTVAIDAGGTLVIGTGGATGSLVTDITDNGLLVFNRASDSTHSNAIAGTGAVATRGGGTLTFTGSSGYTGGTLLEAGTLSLGSAAAIGSTGTISFGGGTLQFTSANSSDYSARFSHAAGQPIVLDTNGRSVTLGSVISGSGSTLTKLGFGAVTLAADNTYTGLTTVAAGTLNVGAGGSSGSLAGNVQTEGRLAFNRSDDTTYAAAITGAGDVAIVGSGRLTLTGSNDYTGGTVLGNGRLAVGSAAAIGSAGTITFAGGTLQFTAANTTDYSGRFSTAPQQRYAIDTNGQSVAFAADLASADGSLAKLGLGTLTLSGSIDLAGGTRIDGGTLSLASAGAVGSSGTISFGGGTLQSTSANATDYSGRFSTAAGQQYRLDTNGQNVTLASALTSSGASLAKFGAGTLTLAGSNDVTAGTAIDGGVLVLGNASALGSAGTISFGGGVLQFSSVNSADYSARFGTQPGQAFALDTNGQDVVLASGLSSSGGTLTKTGLGTLTLTGSSSFSGATTITAGTLQIGAGGSSGSLAGDIVNDAVVIFDRGDAATYAGGLSGSGSVTQAGGGTLRLSGNNSYAGGTRIDAGVLSLGSLTAIGSVGPISFRGGVLQFTAANTTDYSARFSTAGSQTFAFDTNGQSVTLATGLAGAGSELVKRGAGVLELTGSSTYTGSTTVDGGTLRISGGSVADAGGFIGSGAGGAATAAVSHGSWTNAGGLVVGSGSGATGTLDLSGGVVSSGTGLVGDAVGTVGVAAVSGGQWAVANDLFVGGSGSGTLTISSGLVSDENGLLGYDAGGVGVAIITGGTWANRGDLRVGLAGSGTLSVSGSGVVSVGGSLFRSAGSAITLGAGGTLQIGTGTTGGALLSDLANDGTVIFDRADDSTYAGVISGSGGVTKRGAGALMFGGVNTYTGITTIAAGTLQVGNGFSAAGLAGDVVNDAALVFDLATSSTFAGSISGAGSVSKRGAGPLSLTGSSSFNGGLAIDGGAIVLGSVDAIGTAGTISFGGGTLRFTAANTTDYSPRLSGSGSQPFRIDTNGQDVTFASALTGVGSSLTKSGAGTLTLAVDNTATGPITVSAGVLQVGTGGTRGSVAGDLLVDGELIFDRADDATFARTLSGTGTITKLGPGMLSLTGSNDFRGVATITSGTLRLAGGGTIATRMVNDGTVVFGGAGATEYTATMSGSGSLVKADAGTLTLTGTAGSAGDTVVEGGRLDVAAGGLVDQSAASLVIGSAGGTAALGLSGGRVAVATSYVGFNGTGIAEVAGGRWATTGNLVLGWGLEGAASGTLDVSDGTVTNAGAFVGAFSGGSGAVTVSGGTWTSTGGLQVGFAGGNGALTLTRGAVGDASASLGAGAGSVGVATITGGTWTNTGDVVVGSGGGSGTLTISGSGVVIVGGVLSGTGSIGLGAGGTLQIGRGGGSGDLATDIGNDGLLVFNRIDDSTYAGSISGSGAVVKRGAGTLTLTGSNVIAGGMRLEDGSLALGSLDALGAAGELQFGGGTLKFTAADTLDYSARFSTVGGQAYRIDTNGQAVVFATGLTSSGGSLVKDGAGTLALTGSSSYSAGTTILGGTLAIGNGGTTGAITGDVANDSFLAFDRADDITFPGIISGFGNVVKLGAGRLTFTGSQAYFGITTIAAGTLQVGAGGTTGSIRGDVANDGTLVFNRSDAFTYGRIITGTGPVAKLGAGMLTLTGNSSSTGPITISSGTLRVGAGGVAGAISGDVLNNADLLFDRSDDFTYAGAISGTGAVTKLGLATLTLTGSSDFGGLTTITAGTLRIGAGGTAGSIAGNVRNDADLVFDRSDDAVFSGRIAGSGAVGKRGAGTLALTGSSAIDGLTTIHEGVLQIGTGGTNGFLAGDVVNHGVLAFNRSDTFAFGGTVYGDGGLLKRGAGTLEFVGTNDSTGPITISAGTLQIGAGGTAGSMAGDIVNEATLAFNRADDVTYAGSITGAGGVTKLGAGTLTLRGSSSYSGGTQLDAGVLSLGSGDAIGATGAISFDGGVLQFTAVNQGDYSARFSTAAGQLFSIDTNGQDVLLASGLASSGGSLTKDGAGTLTLTGASTYTAGTEILRGTLQVGAGGTVGGIVGNVANAGLLVFNRSDDTAFAGAISGTGTIVKTGSGTLTLTGSSSHTGGTTVLEGRLRIGAGGTTGDLGGDVLNDTAVVFDRSNDSTFSGRITGFGSVTKQGAGTLTLTGSSDYLGATAIVAGALQVGAGGTTGWIRGDVANDGVLAFERGDDVSFDYGISGTGAMVKRGAGTLTLTADSTYAGLTTVSSGTLRIGGGGLIGGIAGDVLNNAGLVFDRADDTSLAGTISGTGTLEKRGAGQFTLANANGFSGTTTIVAGDLRLANAAALAASTVVPLAGGTTSLSPYLVATVGGLDPNAGGLVDVGNGLVTVAGGLSATDLVTALVAGRNGGSWSGTSGITSSVAAADVFLNVPRAVGWLDNGDGSVAFGYAAPGDTNLDWLVDALDLANFLAADKFDTAQAASWLEGDFTYDGIVDVNDASYFASTGLYNVGYYNEPPAALSMGAVAAVPEPSPHAIVAIGMALMGLMGVMGLMGGHTRGFPRG